MKIFSWKTWFFSWLESIENSKFLGEKFIEKAASNHVYEFLDSFLSFLLLAWWFNLEMISFRGSSLLQDGCWSFYSGKQANSGCRDPLTISLCDYVIIIREFVRVGHGENEEREKEGRKAKSGF